MQKTLRDHRNSISIGGRPFPNLKFANDTQIHQEQDMTKYERAEAYGIDVGTRRRRRPWLSAPLTPVQTST
ncbi:hypothetical protein DPMN_039018 [Dreissena polymorpha]|uniref:Uncharacterized protein n=1 Tax=Dreissena polymorpha TaxID=45954 RepID=A0A9D4MI49_DREPO|nr:hypothetical protein DPMN_039018 [Dreissena polymorpha]